MQQALRVHSAAAETSDGRKGEKSPASPPSITGELGAPVVHTPATGDEEFTEFGVLAPPGTMGLRVHILSAGRGADIREIGPSCPFRDEVRVGDRIVAVDGHWVAGADDLRIGWDRPRDLRIARKKPSAGVGSPHIDEFLRGRGCLRAAGADRGKRPVSDAGGSEGRSSPREEPPRRRRTEAKLARGGERFLHEKEYDDLVWDCRCAQLRRFKRDHGGNCNNVPLDYRAPGDMTFGEWVNRQKELFKEGKLAQERIRYLESEGFIFGNIPQA